MSTLINGLAEVEPEYDYALLDIFGVLHDGIRPFPHTVATLQNMKSAGKQICLLSNSPRRARPVAEQLGYMGINSSMYDYIVTSGESTHLALSDPHDEFHQNCGKACWAIGHNVAREILHGIEGMSLLNSPEQASFILNSIPGSSPAEIKDLTTKLKKARDKDLPMICANPDLVVHIGEELLECAGTFAKLYEDMGGRVVYHGKPHRAVYERAYDLLGKPEKARILAVGDSLHTDITGAKNFGVKSVLNLGGIHREEIKPDALDVFKNYASVPDYLITEFNGRF